MESANKSTPSNATTWEKLEKDYGRSLGEYERQGICLNIANAVHLLFETEVETLEKMIEEQKLIDTSSSAKPLERSKQKNDMASKDRITVLEQRLKKSLE